MDAGLIAIVGGTISTIAGAAAIAFGIRAKKGGLTKSKPAPATTAADAAAPATESDSDRDAASAKRALFIISA